MKLTQLKINLITIVVLIIAKFSFENFKLKLRILKLNLSSYWIQRKIEFEKIRNMVMEIEIKKIQAKRIKQ